MVKISDNGLDWKKGYTPVVGQPCHNNSLLSTMQLLLKDKPVKSRLLCFKLFHITGTSFNRVLGSIYGKLW